MAGKSRIHGPASTGGRVESGPPSQRQTATGPRVANMGVGAGTPNRTKRRVQTATGHVGELTGGQIANEQGQQRT